MKRRAEQSLAEGNGLENHGRVKDFLDNAGDIGKVIHGRTVQRWRAQWESEEGGFLLDHRGKKSNISLLDGEDLQLQLATWMKSRLNAVSPNELNTWNIQDFCIFLMCTLDHAPPCYNKLRVAQRVESMQGSPTGPRSTRSKRWFGCVTPAINIQNANLIKISSKLANILQHV
jgi:hypothetical protein